MKLTNMSILKSNVASGDDEIVSNVGYSNAGLSKPHQPEYPYCLKLYLGPEELKKLGFDKLPELGSMLDMSAKVKVIANRLDDTMMGGKTMEVQITDMIMSAPKKEKNPMDALYGETKQEA